MYSMKEHRTGSALSAPTCESAEDFLFGLGGIVAIVGGIYIVAYSMYITKEIRQSYVTRKCQCPKLLYATQNKSLPINS